MVKVAPPTDVHQDWRQPALAVLDMAGTTVDDAALQRDSLERVLTEHGHAPESRTAREAHAYMAREGGRSKFSVFRHVFHGDLGAAHRAHRDFEEAYEVLLAERGISAFPGVEEAIGALRSQGILICLATGFSRRIQNSILESLGWMGLADLSLCPADAGRGRPYPDIVLTAVLALDVEDVRRVLVVGDSTSDMLTGVRSGARRVVGVTTGTHTAEELRAAGATAVLASVADVPAYVEADLQTVPVSGRVPLTR